MAPRSQKAKEVSTYIRQVYDDLVNYRQDFRPTLEEMGLKFSLTRERIRVILNNSLNKGEKRVWRTYPTAVQLIAFCRKMEIFHFMLVNVDIDRLPNNTLLDAASKASIKYCLAPATVIRYFLLNLPQSVATGKPLLIQASSKEQAILLKLLEIIEAELREYDRTGVIKFASNAELANLIGVKCYRVVQIASKNRALFPCLQRRKALYRGNGTKRGWAHPRYANKEFVYHRLIEALRQLMDREDNREIDNLPSLTKLCKDLNIASATPWYIVKKNLPGASDVLRYKKQREGKAPNTE